MSRIRTALLFFVVLFGLTACHENSPNTYGTAKTPVDVKLAFSQMSQPGIGFSVGPLLARQKVYVLFDPQCPHCGTLWKASKELRQKVRMVWIPVGFLSPISASQGAVLLASDNPEEAMTKHEDLIDAHAGGIAYESADSLRIAVVRKNTNMLKALRVSGVPFVVYEKAGVATVYEGEFTPEALAKIL